MKLLNYDARTLIYQNLRSVPKDMPKNFTLTQYRILCNLIRQKSIKKQFFEMLLSELYGLSDWKEMNYWQMYEIIHILTFWNYRKEK